MVMQNRPKSKDRKKIGLTLLNCLLNSRLSKETPPGEGQFMRAWLNPVPLGLCGILQALLNGIDSSKRYKK